MPKHHAQVGSKNPAWKGGRVVASSGYVLLRMPNHHLADSRGYVYEHRLVAEQKIGRRLKPGEISHHINGIKADNRHENIEVLASRWHHGNAHSHRMDSRRADEPNPTMACACGCGMNILKYDSFGRPRRFVTGHNTRGAHGR